MPFVNWTVRVPQTVYDELTALAEQNGTSVSHEARRLLEERVHYIPHLQALEAGLLDQLNPILADGGHSALEPLADSPPRDFSDEARKPFVLRLVSDTHEIIQEIAEANGTTFAEVVRYMLENPADIGVIAERIRDRIGHGLSRVGAPAVGE